MSAHNYKDKNYNFVHSGDQNDCHQSYFFTNEQNITDN